jgi:ribosome-associated GTPase EngA
VTIVGRPNVGKSALYNRLVRRRDAIVCNTPDGHVTRDFREGIAKLGDLSFRVADTCGLEAGSSPGTVQDRASAITARALSRSDIALFLTDGQAGVLPPDESLARWIHKANLPCIVLPVANKCEIRRDWSTPALVAAHCAEMAKLGFGEATPISAETGDGMVDLYQLLRPHIDPLMQAQQERLMKHEDEDHEDHEEEETGDGSEHHHQKQQQNLLETTAARGPLKLAIMGLPNVGKSTLVNRLLGEPRCLTGPEPGLTRDAVKAKITFQRQDIEVIDTAGWIKRQKLPRYDDSGGTVARAASLIGKSTLRLANVVALIVDSTGIIERGKGLTHAEASLANIVVQEGRALLLVANKLDALNKVGVDRALSLLRTAADTTLPEVGDAAIVGLSALKGDNIDELLPAVLQLYNAWCRRVSTAALNKWLNNKAVMAQAKGGGGKYIARVKFLAQTKTRPPTFVASVRGGKEYPEHARRALTNALRSDFNFGDVPLRVVLRMPVKQGWVKSNRQAAGVQ